MFPTHHILVLCTGNSARSIMAEALINRLSQGRLRAYSAGSQPTGRVNPFAMEQVAATGYDMAQLRSKSWDEFAQPDAPKMDIVLTVCDNAAGEVCPIWPGHPVRAHWGFADPAGVQGSDADKRAAFVQVFGQITQRVQALVDLPLHRLDAQALQAALQALAEQPL